MNDLIFFSSNRHKIKEIKKIFISKKINILTITDIPKSFEPQESGNTFNENATIKSEFCYKKFKLPCFADDSGICISALGNLPGIHSKRFLQKNGGYKKTFKKIITEVEKKNNYNAFFQTSIALTTNKKNTVCFEGIVRGKISVKPLGLHGFHYDPIFIPDNNNKTYAQMTDKEKNNISHRSKALLKLIKYLDRLF